MSEFLVTPSIIGIVSLPVGLMIGGIILAGLAARKFVHALEPRTRQAFDQAVHELPHFSTDTLRPASRVEHDARLRSKTAISCIQNLYLPPAESIRVAALISLVSAPYVMENPARLDQPLTALLSAKTVKEAREARQLLLNTAQSNHRQVFVHALTRACINSVQTVGFRNVESNQGALGATRILANDVQGRSLVVEIRPGKNGDPALAAEVLGVSDGSCHQIMDAFVKALAEQGVRYTPPRREATGGVCQLETAREFLCKKLAPVVAKKASEVPDNMRAKRRAQQLDQTKVQLYETR